MFRSTNPVLSRMDNYDGQVINAANTMTVKGTIGKAFLLVLIAAVAGAAVLYEVVSGYTDKVMTILTVSFFVSMIFGFAAALLPKFTKFLAPIYAFGEGALLTGLSLMLESQFPGIAVQAILGTMICFFVMLFLYRTGLVKATEKFRSTLMAAMITIVVLYLINLVGGLFSFSIPFISGSGPMGIAFSAIVVLIAALNFILDFDFIEKGQANYLSKDMEWYGAFGLILTLVWLYVEFLRLLSKLRDR